MHSPDPSPKRRLSVDPVIQRTRGDLDFNDDGLGRRGSNPIISVTCRFAWCGCAAAAPRSRQVGREEC